MRIHDPSPLPPATAALLTKTVDTTGAVPGMGHDFFSSDANAVNVVTFNTAGDNCLKTPEEKVPDAPVFQKLIKGSPDAPIIALQETTPLLAKTLKAEAKNGQFKVIWPGHTWLPAWFPSGSSTSSMVLVPKRYEVQGVKVHSFKSVHHSLFNTIENFLLRRPGGKIDSANRGYLMVSLKDSKTGKKLNIVATHISWDSTLRPSETSQLLAAVKASEAQAPTVVMGDFNTPTLDTNFNHNRGVIDFWKGLEPAQLQDMGPTGKAGVSDWGSGQNIDSVLAKGFTSESHQMLTGNKMTIPGRPDAKKVSDHYAEADSLKFNN
jgi:endonuclease/exonuclease/phosphatase family metal-dependent hydrolase